eukprot:PhM_4_TR13663/c0_g1_i1/m.70832
MNAHVFVFSNTFFEFILINTSFFCSYCFFSLLRSRLLAEDVVEDTAVLEVLNLHKRVDAELGLERLAVAARDRNLLLRLDLAAEVNRELLRARQPKARRALLRQVLDGHDAHADEVAAVDALKGLGDDRAHTEQEGALGSPVARGAGAVLLTREDHEVAAGFLVLHGGIVDRHKLAVEVRLRADGAILAELVCETDVGEGAADHDLVVAAAGAVRVEILALNAALVEVAGGGRVLGDVAGGGDVVRRHRVAEVQQNSCVLNLGPGRGGDGEALEVRRLVNVRALCVPLVDRARGDLERLPLLVADGGVVHVDLLEDVGRDVLINHGLDVRGLGPDILEEHVLAVLVRANGLRGEVEVNGTGEGVRHDEWGRREVVGGRLGVDAGLEVAVA